VGQADGVKTLRAALCGTNPQHVIIYGPPGVGKTAAARLVLEEARRTPGSPFGSEAKFIELDATTARFDERGIADPLIGSVHDPIYQGAGAMGMAGIPQPKPGAVTKAHGGVLFIDEIGELHPIQMNKLLKVLEDRKVFLESAYYSSEDSNVPSHIHDIFQNGLPADFRLVGATTRSPEQLPPAIRSRCLEIFFRPLRSEQLAQIAQNAADRIGIILEDSANNLLSRYAHNGREAVNIIQIAAGVAGGEGRNQLSASDIEWVINSTNCTPRHEPKIPSEPAIGVANGLAVFGPALGTILELEVLATPARGRGIVKVTGIAEEEEIGNTQHVIRRKSMVSNSVDTVITVLKGLLEEDPRKYDLHINFPGGIPVDGPSAGVAMAVASYSAIKKIPVNNLVAMTGEISVRGLVKPVGGVAAKLEAATFAGVKVALIPAENWQESFARISGLKVIPIKHINEALELCFVARPDIRVELITAT
ncbi:MAG: ATP-dependent protease LonB, partial [Peptococcaceae bacterium]|nr:ATP-dependent protease LonB [Peptococcaceae bacterium]